MDEELRSRVERDRRDIFEIASVKTRNFRQQTVQQEEGKTRARAKRVRFLASITEAHFPLKSTLD